MYTIIAADIGGTNCRLGLFNLDDNQLKLEKTLWIATTDVCQTEEFVAAIETALEVSAEKADALVAAIAGPVEDDTRGKLSNGNLILDFTEHKRNQNTRLALINDFTAQAYNVVSPEGAKAPRIAGLEKGAPEAVKAIIGAGTGLGQAQLCLEKVGHKPHRWKPLPSENGWSVFPFLGDDENKFAQFLCKELNLPYPAGDDVITGRGLAVLHHFLTGQKLQPYQVGQGYLCKDTETLAWYSRFYARACRNWMLSTLCAGGLWIAGGIAAQNPLAVKSQYFMDELYGSPRWEEFLKSIPVYLVEDKNSGLWGSARKGQDMLFEGGIE